MFRSYNGYPYQRSRVARRRRPHTGRKGTSFTSTFFILSSCIPYFIIIGRNSLKIKLLLPQSSTDKELYVWFLVNNPTCQDTSFTHLHTNCVTVGIFKFRGNVWKYRNGSLIVTYCYKYLHIRSKLTYFYLKCCVLSFLLLKKKANFSDLKGFASDVQVNVRRKTIQIANIRRFQLQERQHTTFQVEICLY